MRKKDGKDSRRAWNPTKSAIVYEVDTCGPQTAGALDTQIRSEMAAYALARGVPSERLIVIAGDVGTSGIADSAAYRSVVQLLETGNIAEVYVGARALHELWAHSP